MDRHYQPSSAQVTQVCRKLTIHRGTIGEDRSRLLRFESESPPHGDALRDASVTEGTEVQPNRPCHPLFEKGVAIVREEKIQHGTIGEDRSRLLRFESESPPHGDAIRDASVTEGTEV